MKTFRKIKDTIIKIARSIARFCSKIYKCRLLFNFGVKAYNFCVGIYNLIPKYDKITGIDTELLVKNHSDK